MFSLKIAAEINSVLLSRKTPGGFMRGPSPNRPVQCHLVQFCKSSRSADCNFLHPLHTMYYWKCSYKPGVVYM